jgi:AraC-like DNA-binding protein
MTYAEFLPSSKLANDILCLWVHDLDEYRGGDGHRIFPDGCVDLIWVDDAPAMVIGPMTIGRMKFLRPGTRVTGVRFKPGRVQAWLGNDVSELADREVELSEFWNRRFEPLDEAMRCLAGQRLDSAAISAALVPFRPETKSIEDQRLQFAVDKILCSTEVRFDDLAHQVDLSSRHLRRVFNEAVGFGPKLLSRIVRLQRAIALFERTSESDRSLVRISLAAGYADQSHFNRDVKELTGAPPRVVLPGAWTALGAMSDSFKTSLHA